MKNRRHGHRGDLALKIDISKAYDRVDWSYLEKFFSKLGFAQRWVQWMMMYVRSVKYSIQVNDDLVGLIVPSRGLRQRDTLWPYLSPMTAFFLEADRRLQISNIVGVHSQLNTGRYLGLPSLVGRNKRDIFSYIKDRLWRKLQRWKGRNISKGFD